MDIDLLVKQIKRKVAESPETFSIIQAAANEGLQDFIQLQKDKRDNLADKAIMVLMARYTIPKNTNPAYLFDIAYCHFPTGLTNYTPKEKEFWDKFVELVNNQPLNPFWIFETKGVEALTWWNQYIKPLIK